ncbi:MAG TPA: hypothetical protein VKU44_03850 [Terriglobia bacterium]|nr:hypothetical protein [Terriglobia bacterium]
MRVLGDLTENKPERWLETNLPPTKPQDGPGSPPPAKAGIGPTTAPEASPTSPTSAPASQPDAELATPAPDPNASAARRASAVGEIPVEMKPAGPADRVNLFDRVDQVYPAERFDRAEPAPRGTRRTGGSNGSHTSTDDRRSRPPESPRTRTGAGAWLAIFVLAAALAGVTGYGYLALRRNNVALAQLPGMAQLTNALGGRMDTAEAKLRDLTDNWGALAGRVTALDHKMNTVLAKTRQQTATLLAAAESRMQAETDRRAQVVDARLDRVESAQTENKTQIAQVQEQMQKQVAGLRQELAGNRDDTSRDLAALHNQVDQSQTDTHALARQIAQERVNFEATRNSTIEIVPGVSLTILKTNVSYQRFEGYVSLASDGRTLWLRNAGLRQAVSFYSEESERPYDLVVTRVNRDGVVGYLLVPAGARAG